MVKTFFILLIFQFCLVEVWTFPLAQMLFQLQKQLEQSFLKQPQQDNANDTPNAPENEDKMPWKQPITNSEQLHDYLIERFPTEILFSTSNNAHKNEEAIPANANDDRLLVETENGKVLGFTDRQWKHIRQFLGIPYAQPPIKSLRWSNPVPPTSWQPHVLKTTRMPPACPQPFPFIQSEDCLYLNIYTPTAERYASWPSDRLLPVLIWIHGGGWAFGSGEFAGVQDPSYMVQHRDVVVVTVRYRLGPLGFLASHDLDGNYGFLDQQLAIRWVHSNIDKFGGNPNSITLWGESAGAMSVGFHLTAGDGPADYIKGAIMQSNVLGLHYQSLQDARKIGKQMCKKVGCLRCSAKCLRRKSTAQILFARLPIIPDNSRQFLADLLAWKPVIDGENIRGQPLDLLESKAKNVAILMGYNTDEAAFAQAIVDIALGSLFGLKQPLLNGKSYEKLMKIMFKKNADKVLELYPSDKRNITQNINKLIELTTDFMVVCPNVRVAKRLSQGAATYFYVFDFWAQYLPPLFFSRCKKNHVCHAMELPYVFHSLQHLPIPIVGKFTEEEHALSHMFVDYYADFATHHELFEAIKIEQHHDHDNGNNLGAYYYSRPPWPRVSPDDRSLNLDFIEFRRDGSAAIRNDRLRAEYCEFWDSYDVGTEQVDSVFKSL